MLDDTAKRLRERLQERPDDRAAFESLEEYLFVQGDWAQLVALYEERLAAPDLDAEADEAARGARARVLFRLGQVLEERRHDSDRAATHYAEAAELDPGFRPVLSALRVIHEQRCEWPEALEIAARESDLPMRTEEQAELSAHIGVLVDGHLDDPERALDHFERALEADPEHVVALLGAARVRVAKDEPEVAAALLERAIDREHGPERAAAQVALAELCDRRLGAPERAEELYRSALTEDPGCQAALEALCAHAENAEQWELLDDLTERRFALAAGAVRRLAIAHHAARVQLERARNPRTTRHWLARALEYGADDPVVHLLLADVEALCGDPTARLPHLRRAIELAGDAIPVDVIRECAELSVATGDLPRAADDLHCALLRIGPDEALLDALENVLVQLGRDADFADALEEQLDALDAREPGRLTVLLRLATAQEERLGDTDAARASYEAAAEIAPDFDGIVEALDRLHRKLEDWEGLRGHVERTLDALAEGDARAPALRCTLGELLLEHLADASGARASFEAALEDRTLVAGSADERRAREGLERIALASGDESAIIETFEREAAVTTDAKRLVFLAGELRRIFERRDEPLRALRWVARWCELVADDPQALEARAELEQRVGQVTDALRTREQLDPLLAREAQLVNRRTIGALHRDGGDAEAAIGWFESALVLEPDDLASLDAIEPLLRDAGRERELADVLHRRVDRGDDPATSAHRFERACLLADSLGDPEGALAELRMIVDAADAPPGTHERLEALLESTGRGQELFDRLSARREPLDDGSEARALDLRRAQLLLEPLRRPSEAALVLAPLYEADPTDEAIGRAYEDALRGARHTDALLALLGDRAAACDDPEARATITLARAELLEEQGDRDAQAADELEAIANGETEQAACAERRLQALLERGGEFARLRSRLDRALAALGRDREEAAGLHERIARLCRDRLRDAEGAIEHYERAATLAQQPAPHFQALARLYQEEQRADDQVRAIEGELSCDPDAERALELHARAADLCRGALDDDERATGHYQALLELDPGQDDAAEFLLARLDQTGRHEELASVLAKRLDRAEQRRDGSALALRLRLAAVCAAPLDDVARAIGVLEPAVEDDSQRLVAADPLADLYRRAGRTEELVTLAARAADSCDEPDERAAWWWRAGDAQRAAGDERAAAESLRRVLTERPGHSEARAGLRVLYRALCEHDALARLLEGDLAHAGGDEEVAIRCELAALYADSLDQPHEALAHRRRVLELDPRHTESLDAALVLAQRIGQPPEWLALSQRRLALPSSTEQRVSLLAQRGRLLAEQPGEAADAIRALRDALALRPGDDALRAELRELMTREGDRVGQLACLDEEIARASQSDPQRAAGLCEQAVVLAEGDDALAWLERLRTLRADDASVWSAMAALHRRAGRSAELERTLEGQLDREADPERRVALLCEIGSLRETSGALLGALRSFEMARETAPENPDVLAGLDRLYDCLGRDRERADLLAQRAQLARDDARRSLRRERARLLRRVGDPQAAADETWASLVGCEGVDRAELLRELTELLHEANRPDLAVRAAAAELTALVPDQPVFAERRAALHEDLARRLSTSLGRPSEARQHYAALLDQGLLTPQGATAARHDEAERGLIALLRRTGDAVSLEARLSARLERGARDASWLEVGRLRLEALHKPAAAADAFRAALDRDASDLSALRGLRCASERLGRFEEVAETLDAEVALRSDAPASERAALWKRLGELAWRELDDTPRARRALESAIEARPKDLGALRTLEALLEATEDIAGAAALFEREVEVLGDADPDRRTACWIRVGALARGRLDDAENSLRALDAAAEIGALPLEWRLVRAELLRDAGDLERFVEVFEDWCDDPDSPAEAHHHLDLAHVLRDRARPAEAIARARRAARLGGAWAEPFDTIAELEQALGQPEAAAEALAEAAERSAGGEAADRRLAAANLIAALDPERALGWLERAVADSPSHALAQAALARIAEAQNDPDRAHRAARAALTVPGLDDADAIDVALIGGWAARAQGDLRDAARLLSEGRALASDDPRLLAEHGEVLFELGELAAAREALGALLESGESDPAQALHEAQMGRALVEAGEPGDAIGLLRSALERDDTLAIAHSALADALVAAGHPDEAVAALRDWATVTADAAACGGHLLRAARLLAEDTDAACALLAEANEICPANGEAWLEHAQRLAAAARDAEALEVCDRARAQTTDGVGAGPLSALRARLLERSGEREAAADAFALAAELDPCASDAALEGARLLRELGRWRDAASGLERFAAAAPPDRSEVVGPVLLQLGRLLAGPLEDVERAIVVYRRALDADPDSLEAREALAGLLVHCPDHEDEAIALHEALLGDEPLRLGSLRALLTIARRSGAQAAEATGLALLGALGVLTTEERESAPRAPSPSGDCTLGDPVFDSARRLAQAAAPEIGRALGVGEATPRSDGAGDAVARFRAALTRAEGELSAPALVPLPDAEAASVLSVLAQLVLDDDTVQGDGELVNALAEHVNRRTRRRLRREIDAPSPRAFAELDVAAWRAELRALAALRALEGGKADLRTALLARLPVGEEERRVPEDADLRARVLGSGDALVLVRRIVRDWLRALRA